MGKNFEKIDVFRNIVFGGILEGFWEGFGEVFGAKNRRFWQMRVFRENLKNINFP